MSKKVVFKADHISSPAATREAERKKQQNEKSLYLGNMADKVLDAIEKIFEETTPTPTGNDLIDVLALAPVFAFAEQIRMSCKSKKSMQSVMRSSMRALTNQIVIYAAPFMEEEEPWDEIAGEEGGNNGGTESKEL